MVIDHANHSLEIEGDVWKSLAIMERVLRAIDAFLKLKRIVQYVATGSAASGAKLQHDDFLTSNRQGVPGAVDRQTRRSAAAA